MRGSTGVATIGAVLATVSGVELLTGGPLDKLDVRVALHYWPVTWSPSTHLARFLQYVGQPWIACATIGALSILASLRRRRLGPAIVAGAGLGIVGLATWLLKEVFPHRSILTQSPGSFPSGHTGVAVVASGLVVWLLLPRRPWRDGVVLAVAAVWGALMAWGRLVLETHWLSDVIAGWGLGVVALVLSLRTADWLRGRPGSAPPTRDGR
jgi:undecaprenyl-diphosphatase